jgi:hypothetical protein
MQNSQRAGHAGADQGNVRRAHELKMWRAA